MTCEAIRERLDDYVDQLLEGPAQEEVRLHLIECEACAGEAREVRRLVELARALPRELAPSHDLWPQIAGLVGARREGWLWYGPDQRWGGREWAGLAAAATLVVAAALAAWWSTGAATAPTRSVRSGEAVRASYEANTRAVEEEYARAEAAFVAAIEARSSRLSPESRARVDASLRVIDQALAEIRVELGKNPSDPQLNLLLVSVHQRKVDVLRTVVRLTT